jgi:hypothetical protein
MRLVSEEEFSNTLTKQLSDTSFEEFGVVTGPGRSGAVAAVYASHFLHIPFIPYGANAPNHLGRLLIIDTAEQTGKTIRKASRRYENVPHMVHTLYKEPPRVYFWYEAPKPQHYKHERVQNEPTRQL